jgi:hypothetical protein
MVRRGSIVATVVAVILLCTGLAGVAAQEATPTSAMFADTIGLPELRVQITDTAYEGLPAETAAGRYLLTLEVETAEGGGLNFLRLPEGMTFDDFMALLAGPSAASPEAMMGTPGAEAGPPEGEDEDRPPEWFFQAEMAGGTGAFAGPAQAIIDLTPGE